MNATLTRTRATTRVAPTLHDGLVVLSPVTGYGRGDSCGHPGTPFHETSETPAPQDLFATAPMKVMRLEFDRQREEEAYTSFEAAISDRVLALKERRLNASGNTPSALNRLANMIITAWRKLSSRNMLVRGGPQGSLCGRSRPLLLLVGMALVLMLAGFDLMGLLVLYAR